MMPSIAKKELMVRRLEIYAFCVVLSLVAVFFLIAWLFIAQNAGITLHHNQQLERLASSVLTPNFVIGSVMMCSFLALLSLGGFRKPMAMFRFLSVMAIIEVFMVWVYSMI